MTINQLLTQSIKTPNDFLLGLVVGFLFCCLLIIIKTIVYSYFTRNKVKVERKNIIKSVKRNDPWKTIIEIDQELKSLQNRRTAKIKDTLLSWKIGKLE